MGQPPVDGLIQPQLSTEPRLRSSVLDNENRFQQRELQENSGNRKEVEDLSI
jgi:hypothetical protein